MLLLRRSFASSGSGKKSLAQLKNEMLEIENQLKAKKKELSEFTPEGKQRVLVLGAGLSSSALIDYLRKHAADNNWFVRVGDMNEEVAMKKARGDEFGVGFGLDLDNPTQLEREVADADLVISMLPVPFHPRVAEACLEVGRDMLTASYASPAIMEYDEAARKRGLLFMMECGVDPGIDHMGSMSTLNLLKGLGCEMLGFESFTGGLVAPEHDDNPWGYKVTWNPRNVVLSGSGVSKFIQNGRYKYIPYTQVYRRYETISIPGYGDFAGYANRDSLKYRDYYNLQDCPTVFRGTLRRPGFCEAWDVFVQLGMTDDSYAMEDTYDMTYRQFINSFLLYRESDSVELKLAYQMHLPIDSPIMKKLRWLGIFEERKIGLHNATPAQIMQKLIAEKWKLGPEERDMLVMYNLYKYKHPDYDQPREMVTAMITKGENASMTAMAKTVGLPVGIVARQILRKNLAGFKGVTIPIYPEIYEPVLAELKKDYGIEFMEVNPGSFASGMGTFV